MLSDLFDTDVKGLLFSLLVVLGSLEVLGRSLSYDRLERQDYLGHRDLLGAAHYRAKLDTPGCLNYDTVALTEIKLVWREVVDLA